jgi:hypothetical protein
MGKADLLKFLINHRGSGEFWSLQANESGHAVLVMKG